MSSTGEAYGTEITDPSPSESAARWLEEFAEALQTGNIAAVDDLFGSDGWWRDLLSLTWDLRTLHGKEMIKATLEKRLKEAGFSDFALDGRHVPELVKGDGEIRFLLAFFVFETTLGRGRGVVRLLPDGAGWKAWTVFTALEELKGHEEASGSHRPKGTDHGVDRARESWLDRRRRVHAFEDAEPEVLIVGAGQSGLSVAARLEQVGLRALVIEKNKNVGDNWRARYHTLVLHDPVWSDHLPYLPFPEAWPVFTPKDKLADWLEFYASTMELNVWTETVVRSAAYDEDQRQWTVQLVRADGSGRTLHPAHLIIATGASGQPHVPEIAGLEDFQGTVQHSSAFDGGAAYAGCKAVVVGAGVSGHDIAQDLFEQGAASVTMVQRSSTYVFSSENGLALMYKGLYEQGGPPTEDADLLFISLPFLLLGELSREMTDVVADLDRDILEGLARAGFKTDMGDNGSGALIRYLQRGGGYYLDVGCSSLIANGQIGIKQGVEIERFVKDGIRFVDGTTLEADVVVLATGYTDMRETARTLLGDQIADRCRPVWGLDEEGELRSVWRDSGHPGLWFMAGNLVFARIFSRYLALQIRAIQSGLHPEMAH